MISWYKFEEIHGSNIHTSFEDMSYDIFCKILNIDNGLIRRINQPYIETDPVRIGDELIGFQARYYDSRARLNEKLPRFKTDIEGAAHKYHGLTKICYFVHGELTASSKMSEYKPDYQIQIEEYAQKFGIKIEWYDSDRIGSLLRQPKYRYIYAYYFYANHESITKLLEYYIHVQRLFTSINNKEASLVGNISLRDSYIEPYYIDEMSSSKRKSVIKELESWCEATKNGIHIIHGQPGHGKTSLCLYCTYAFSKDLLFQKYDYQAKGSQLTGHRGTKTTHIGTTVENVLWFSLNPIVARQIIDGSNLNLSGAFCWGAEGENKYFTKNVTKLKNSLIFLDGYDELIVLASQLTKTSNLRDFLYKVMDYAVEYNIHFVITSRTASIWNELKSLPEDINIKIMVLDAITRQEQIDWMNKQKIERDYIDYIQGIKNKEMQKMLGIPIIFRMIVNARLRDLNNQNIVAIYDQLFQKTMDRHHIPIKDGEGYHKELQSIAYQMFCAGEQTIAYSEDQLKKSIGYTYYIEVENILGFYHRSFYQYFLSHYIYARLSAIEDEHDAELFLSDFSLSVIDTEVLHKLDEIKQIKRESSVQKIELLLSTIEHTDSIFPVANMNLRIRRLVRFNYAYYNALRIAYTWNVPIKTLNHKRTCELLRKYDVRNSAFYSPQFIEQSFSRVNWDGVSIEHASLINTSFSYAALTNALIIDSIIQHSSFVNTLFTNSNLYYLEFSNSDLSKADFSKTNISDSEFDNSDCRSTIFKHAQIERCSFRNTCFSNVDFSGVHFLDCPEKSYTMINCQLIECNFYGASLSGAKFNKTLFRKLSFARNNLLGVSFSTSNILDVKFIGAYAVNLSLNNSSVKKVSFNNADLRSALFESTHIEDADFSRCDLRGATFKNSVLINPVFTLQSTENSFVGTRIDEHTVWDKTIIYIDPRREDLNETKTFLQGISVEVVDLKDFSQ